MILKNGADLCVKGGDMLRECWVRSGNEQEEEDDFATFEDRITMWSINMLVYYLK